MEPKFAATRLFRDQLDAQMSFAEKVIDRIGAAIGGPNSTAKLVDGDAEVLLRFFDSACTQLSEQLTLTETRKQIMRSSPVFETAGGGLTAIDTLNGIFTFQPNLCGGLFKAEADSRFLMYKPDYINLYTTLGVEFLSESDIFARFLLPGMDTVEASDRSDQIQYIRRNWAKTLSSNPDFVEKLKHVSFVTTKTGRTARPSELYHPSHPIFSKVFPTRPVFPTGEFLQPEWISILETLGLVNQLVDSTTFFECAKSIDQLARLESVPGEIDMSTVRAGAALLASHFVKHCNQIATDATFCRQLADLQILPVKPPQKERNDGCPGLYDDQDDGDARCDELNVSSAREVLASYTEVATARDWPLVWTVQSVCPDEFLPPQPFWSRLGIKTPPPVAVVVAHIAAIPHDVLERWSFTQSREAVFGRIYEYLEDRLDDVPLPQLQQCAMVPIANTLVKPTRLFFKLPYELSPFIFEVPRVFGAHDKLFRALGVRETTSEAVVLLQLLRELGTEFDGQPLNPTESAAVRRTLQLLADAVETGHHLFEEVYVPACDNTLRPASTLLYNDANWMVPRIDLREVGVTFADPALDIDLASRFGIERLSQLVVETIDDCGDGTDEVGARGRAAHVPDGRGYTAVEHPEVERWSHLLQTEEFLTGVAHLVSSCPRLGASGTSAEDVRTQLSGFAVQVVSSISTRFIERFTAAGLDVTRPGSTTGSKFFVDGEHRLFYLSEQHAAPPHGEELLAQAIGHRLQLHPAVQLSLAPLLRSHISAVATIPRLLDGMRICESGGVATSVRRGTPGAVLLEEDRAQLQLRPLRSYTSGEVVAWKSDEVDADGRQIMRYGTVVAPGSGHLDQNNCDALATGTTSLQTIEVRLDKQIVKRLLTTSIYSFRSNRNGRAPATETRLSLASHPSSLQQTPQASTNALELGITSRDPHDRMEGAEAGRQGVDDRTVSKREVVGAVHDLLTMLDLPLSLQQQELLEETLRLRQEVAAAAAEKQRVDDAMREVEAQLQTFKDAFTCQICMHARANLALVSCGHRFCNGCMHRLESNGSTRCAFCRQSFTGTVPVFL
eukprot:SAG31_NODE_2551_length_5512_cov_1.835027_1_plen_1069_part_00